MSNQGDFQYDFNCSDCEEHELNSEAVLFCGQCHRQFCNLCNQQHLRFYPTHHTLDQDQRTEWGTVIYADTKSCQKHPKKLGSSLCLDHNVICCLQCSTSTHGKCKHVQRLPKKPKPEKLKQTSSLTKEKKITVSESEITSSTSKTRSNLRVKSLSLKDKSDKSARLARQGQSKAQSESSDDVRDYVEGRKPRKEIGSDFVQEYVDGKRVTGVYFGESGYAGAVSEFQVSGRRPGQTRKNSDIGVIGRNHKYRVLSKHVYKVRMDGESPCEITGICQLADGRIVIIDFENCKVKLLDKGFKIVDCLVLPEYPRNVAVCGDSEIAVTVSGGDSHEIHFFNAGATKLESSGILPLQTYCSAITHHAGHIYVASLESVYLYTRKGRKLEEVHKSHDYDIRNIAVEKENHVLYVTDFANDCVNSIDIKSSNLISKFENEEMHSPTGVTLDNKGQMFVCGKISETILQVDQASNEMVQIVASEDDGLCQPHCLLFDETSCTLIVGQWNDSLLVLRLE